MGEWDDEYQVITQHSITANAGTSLVDSFLHSIAKAVEWRYVIDNGSGTNMRTGVIQAVWDQVEHDPLATTSIPVMMPEKHSEDIGTTLGVVSFSVDKLVDTIRLLVTTTSDSWTVSVVRTLIGASS